MEKIAQSELRGLISSNACTLGYVFSLLTHLTVSMCLWPVRYFDLLLHVRITTPRCFLTASHQLQADENSCGEACQRLPQMWLWQRLNPGKMPPGSDELSYERSPRWSVSLPSAANGRISVVRACYEKLATFPPRTNIPYVCCSIVKCAGLHQRIESGLDKLGDAMGFYTIGGDVVAHTRPYKGQYN
jgi:hypothetical protein